MTESSNREPTPEAAEGKAQREREQTDQSLHTERVSTDQAISDSKQDTEQSVAAEVVDHAREQADAVLEAARDKADQKQPVRAGDGIAAHRAREDREIEAERAAADELLAAEREQQLRRLAALLPLEREKTDRYLLTERERSDAALEHRDDFMAMVTHDLRNLLSGIFLNANALSEEASGSEEGRRTAAGMLQIHRYVARMNRLIGDLVDVSSIDAGKLAMLPRPNDAAKLVAEAIDAFAAAAKEKGVTLVAEPLPAGLVAEYDHDRLLQVLANLITNALKFTPRGGKIAVLGSRATDGFCVTVRDTGIGIPGGMLEAVFERFWQVGKNDQRGRGLGLYISRSIVSAHGGRIWAESNLGTGSAFHFTIPGLARGTRARAERSVEETADQAWR